VNAQVLIAEAVDESASPLDDFRADDIPVERVRAFPIGHRDHAVVDYDIASHRLPYWQAGSASRRMRDGSG
jgi:hypothetical protein